MELSLTSCVFIYLLLALFLYSAKRWGLFDALPPKPTQKRLLSPITPLGAFGIYFLGSLLFPLLLQSGLKHFTYLFTTQSPVFLFGMVQAAVIIVVAVTLILFIQIHSKEIKMLVWGHRAGALRLFCKGVMLAVLIYPLTALFMQAVHIAVEGLYPFTRVDQLAVDQIRRLKDYPVLRWGLSLEVAFLVPVIEELLFRGCTQTFFSSFFGTRAAISLASLLFALMHYAPGQGLTNIELLSTLFLLSFLMGCAYSRERSLWMPIGMHCGFNTVSLLLM